MSQPEAKLPAEIHPVLSLTSCEACDDDSDTELICIKPRKKKTQTCSPSCQCGGDDECRPVPELEESSDEEDDLPSPMKPAVKDIAADADSEDEYFSCSEAENPME